MNGSGRVLLITGPMGSGKSTLAGYISRELDWLNISEDKYWVKNGWSEGLRSEEQEEIIQEQVLSDLLSICQIGKSAVLEFILYKNLPNSLSQYTENLTKASIKYDVVILKPSVEEILKRIQKRGRPDDVIQLEKKRTSVKEQVQCLDAENIKQEWVINSTNISEIGLVDIVIDKLKASS